MDRLILFVFQSNFQGAGGESTAQAYEIALRRGVRHVVLELANGGTENIPLVGGVRLDEVLQTIRKVAFVASKHPLIISLDGRCNLENLSTAAKLLKDIFGSSLLTRKVGSPEKLPSPEQLKGKIVVSAWIGEESFEAVDESKTEHAIGEVWFLSKEEDEKEEDVDKRGWKKRDMILRGDTLSFHAQTSEILTKMSKKPYFVGPMVKTAIEAFIRALPEEKIQKGTFFMYCNQCCTEFRMVVCRRIDEKVLHFPIKLNDKTKMFYLETALDRDKEHKSIEKLVKFYQLGMYGGEGNMISLQTNLGEPMQLQGTDIHKYTNWYKGNLDDNTTKNIMASVTDKGYHKGAFLVREPEEDGVYDTHFFLEYFDGNSPQKLVIQVNLDESEVTVSNVSKNFGTITEVVNHFRVNYITGNATKLCDPIQLVGEIVEDGGAGGGVKRNQLSIKRISTEEEGNKVAVDKNEDRHAREKVKIKTKEAAPKKHEDEDHETTLTPGVKVEERDLDNKFLKLSHNKKIVISRPGRGCIELTKDDDDIFDIDILLDALRSWTENTRIRKGTTVAPPPKPPPHPLSDLVVYCKHRKDPLDMTQVVEGKINTKLRQFNQTGLLKMIGRTQCLDYTCITSNEMDRMLGIVNVNNIEDIIQFHKNILSNVHPRNSLWPKGDPKPMWLSGAQLVGVHHHDATTADIQTNNAMFTSNGNCGYVLKPNVLLTGPETSCIITLKIIEARHLRTLKHINEQLFEPHIRVRQL